MDKPFVEGISEHDIPLYDEVGGVEISIGISLALEIISVLRAGRFEDISQVIFQPFHGFRIPLYLISAIDDVALLFSLIFGKILLADYVHIAVDKEQPGIFCLLSQEIPDCSPAHVLFSFDISAMGEGIDDAVLLYGSLIGRTVIGNQDFVFERGE